jgi:hypothetical protein
MPGLLSPAAHVRPFAEWLLEHDLPALGDERRAAAVGFVVHRVEDLPSPIAAGVAVMAVAARVLLTVPGGRAVLSALTRRPVPGVGEYVRLVRSLGYAYVWDAWPDTRPDGSLPR